MANNISMADSVWETITEGISTVRNANSSFNKDLTATMQKLETLNKTKTVLRLETKQAKHDLEEAEKQFQSTGSAADDMAMRTASLRFDGLNKNLSFLSDNIKNTKESINDMVSTANKADKQSGTAKVGGVLKSLAGSELGQMAINTGLNVATTGIGSAFGSDAATMFSGTASGAISGAMIGSEIAPVIGTLIGGVAGAALGAIDAQNKIFEQKDAAFKSEVQDSFNNGKNVLNEALTRGTTVAANREQDQLSFSKALGNDNDAKSLVSALSDFSTKNAVQYDVLSGLSKTLLSNGYKQEQIVPMLTKLGDAGAALGMSSDGMNTVAAHLGNLTTSDKVSADDLNAIQSQGIKVWQYIAAGLQTTQEEAQKMVADGKVTGSQTAQIISDAMGKEYSGNMQKRSQTYNGLQTSYQNKQDEMNAAMGDGYNKVRKSGMQDQIQWMQGDSGDKMKDAYSMIGEYKAALENTHEKSIRDAMDGAMDTAEYKQAALVNNRVKMGEILTRAQAQGENKFKASDEYQAQLKSDLNLAAEIRDDKAMYDNYWDSGYKMGQQFTTGLNAAMIDNRPIVTSSYLQYNTAGPKVTAGVGYLTLQSGAGAGSSNSGNGNRSKPIGTATGIFRVPYNNFPALLHEGETVSTAVEARSAKYGPSVTITGNSFIVREEADIDKIARAFVEKLSKAAVVSVAS